MFCPLKHFVFRKYFDGEVEPRQVCDFKSPHGVIYGLSRRSSGSVRTTDGAIIKHQGMNLADSWTWICEWRKMNDKSGPSIFIDMPELEVSTERYYFYLMTNLTNHRYILH
jgi:hypothetical protein